jgi:hypothetical protein
MPAEATGQDGAVDPLLAPEDLARLRETLAKAGYTSRSIAARIGPIALDAVRRNDLRGLLRATTDRDPLATLIRLFLAGQTEPADAVEAALAPLPVEAALGAGLVEVYGDGIHAGVDLDVYTGHTGEDWWILSDLDADARPGPLRTDHVLGVGNAAMTLAGATIRTTVPTALDIGTGCGVQALELGAHAGRVTATDLSDRALRFAATTAALNRMSWELLAGDMVAPVGRRGRRGWVGRRGQRDWRTTRPGRRLGSTGSTARRSRASATAWSPSAVPVGRTPWYGSKICGRVSRRQWVRRSPPGSTGGTGSPVTPICWPPT